MITDIEPSCKLYMPEEMQILRNELPDINPNEPLFLDTETDGLYGKVQFVSLYQKSWGRRVAGFRTHKWTDFELIAFLSPLAKKCEIIGHNLFYDINCSNYMFPRWEDTFLLGRLAYPMLSSHSLDSMLVAVLGFDPYTMVGIDKKKTAKSNYGTRVLTNTQWAYACYDAFYLGHLYDAVKDFRDHVLYKQDIQTCKDNFVWQKNGFPVDLEAASREYENLKKQDKELADKLPQGLNVNSWQQVRKYLGTNESSEAFLLFLWADVEEPQWKREAAKAIIDRRKVIKLMQFIDSIESDRLYGHFSPTTKSGRMQCSEVNLQQLPRKLKPIYGFPKDSDRIFVYADFSALEIHTIASIIGEHKMLQVMKEDGDIHTFTATYLFSLPAEEITAEQREVAKLMNFLLLYGGGVYMLRLALLKRLGILYPESEVSRLIKMWMNLFPAIATWQEEEGTLFPNKRGSNPRQLGATPMDRPYSTDRLQDYLAIKNQGFGAEIAKETQHKIFVSLKDVPDAKLVNMVHDSYTCDVRNDPEDYTSVAKIMAESMYEEYYRVVRKYAPNVAPMPFTAGVGNNWKTADKSPIYTYEITRSGERKETWHEDM